MYDSFLVTHLLRCPYNLVIFPHQDFLKNLKSLHFIAKNTTSWLGHTDRYMFKKPRRRDNKGNQKWWYCKRAKTLNLINNCWAMFLKTGNVAGSVFKLYLLAIVHGSTPHLTVFSHHQLIIVPELVCCLCQNQ